jgi:hypothetical protein
VLLACQVYYPGDIIRIPFAVGSPLLRTPAALQYTLASTSGEDPRAYLPQRALRGALLWDMQPGEWLNLTLPLNWSAVPPDAEYRLSLSLASPWRARASGDAANVTAVHIFGVLPDQCPPGTFR